VLPVSRSVFVVWVIAALIGTAWGYLDVCSAREHCTQLGPIETLRQFLHDWEAAIVGLGTIAIAAFTLTLSKATRRLWVLSEQQARITERAYIAVSGLGIEPFGMESVARDHRRLLDATGSLTGRSIATDGVINFRLAQSSTAAM
jgi:hypothetical protein